MCCVFPWASLLPGWSESSPAWTNQVVQKLLCIKGYLEVIRLIFLTKIMPDDSQSLKKFLVGKLKFFICVINFNANVAKIFDISKFF